MQTSESFHSFGHFLALNFCHFGIFISSSCLFPSLCSMTTRAGTQLLFTNFPLKKIIHIMRECAQRTLLKAQEAKGAYVTEIQITGHRFFLLLMKVLWPPCHTAWPSSFWLASQSLQGTSSHFIKLFEIGSAFSLLHGKMRENDDTSQGCEIR